MVLLMIGLYLIAIFQFYFLWNVMVLENRYYFAAIRRSRELASGHWLRILVIIISTLVLYYVISFVLLAIVFTIFGLSMLPFVASGPSPTGPMPVVLILGVTLFYALFASVVVPLLSVVSVLFYFDVRVRKEGFDIELLAQEMGGSVA
jgi:hypothetical protein